MATVPALSSVAARMMRTAISARLAAMMRPKGGVDDTGLGWTLVVDFDDVGVMVFSSEAGGSVTTERAEALGSLEVVLEKGGAKAAVCGSKLVVPKRDRRAKRIIVKLISNDENSGKKGELRRGEPTQVFSSK